MGYFSLRLAVNAIFRNRCVYAFDAEPVNQHVGRRVIADGVHQHRDVVQRQRDLGAHVFEQTRASGLIGRADGAQLVKLKFSGLGLAKQLEQDPQFHHAGGGEDLVGIHQQLVAGFEIARR
jgi:hypothetical protein